MIIPYIVEKAFLSLLLQAFSTEEMLICQIKDYFKINGKQRIIMPKKMSTLNSKIMRGKMKPPFIIYADFESILVPKDNGKQNPEQSYTNKY